MKVWVTRKKVQWMAILVDADSLAEARRNAKDGEYDDEFDKEENDGNYSADYSFTVERKK